MSGGTPAASSSLRAALSYCVRQVRAYDYHHYLCLLHLAPAMRKAAFTFRAFNIETARAMDVVSDPRTCLMRLLWWKEAVDKVFGNKLVEHPVAQALSSVIADHKVSKHWLKRSVEARINDANREEGTIPGTSAELERAGKRLPDAVFKVASVAEAHLHKARELASSVPKEAIPVLLPALPAQVLLDTLRRCEFNVFDPRLSRGVHGVSPLWYQLKLNWNAWRSRY
ncbi:Terpenoid synthases superfamily protein [Zea mays]|uniref:Terpenoid synthases superfamily protein n=1 Tax=Zea mays TaxID=4577 RepID=A0A1D6LKM3_MAIZE|nr:Terpenoid synthases superfamily protein [Zea mays]